MSTSLAIAGESFGLTEAGTLAGTSNLTRRRYTPTRLKHITEAAILWGRAWEGDRRAALSVQEALSTSDLFRSVTGDVLDREILARYNELPVQWTGFARRTVVRNFKPKKLIDILGGRTALDEVPELTEYPEAAHDVREYEIRVRKFGRRFGFSWEASINDDIDELQAIPDAFAAAARATEDKTALELLVTAAGAPNPEFFNAENGNAPTTLVLSHENLSTAITVVSTKEDEDGDIVAPEGLRLVVGPALEMEARRIINATEVRVQNGNRTVLEPNWLKGAIELEVNRRLKGTSWFVVPTPSSARPAFALAFLRGFETPDIRLKNVAGTSVGGGPVDPSEGSFDEDGVYYRVRHVTGGATVDPIHTYASTGAGS